jgi:ABC-2 type transport system permease protein
MSNLRVLRGIFIKDLKYAIRNPGRIVLVFILPYLLTVMVGAMGRFMGGVRSLANFAEKTGTTNAFEFQVLGASMWIISWVTIDRIGSTLREERINGTLEQSYLAPINRFLMLAAMALVQFVTTGLTFIVVVVLSISLEGQSSPIGLAQAFLMLTLGIVPLFGISFIFAGIVVRFKEPQGFVSIANLVFSILMGVYYPISILPYWAQVASRFLPQTYALEAMRSILLSNVSITHLYSDFGALFAMAIVYPIVGYFVFKTYLDKARVSGDLSKF